MAPADPVRVSPDFPNRSKAAPDPNQFSAIRIAGSYLLAGSLWILLSDLILLWSSELTAGGYLLSAGKGASFVLLSTALVFWLSRREFQTTQRAAALLRAVVEGTTDAVYVKDCAGRHLLVNEAAARFLGRPVSDVLGRDPHELFEASDAKRLIASDQAIMAGGKVATFEETLTSDGVSRIYHATKAPYRDSCGNLIGLVGISRDITDRKRAEIALIESEERCRQLADAIPQIVCTSGADGAITHMNAESGRYLGMEPTSLTDWSWEQVVHPDDLDHAREQWISILGDGLPRPVEMRIRRADGSYRWHICRQRPIRNGSGGIISWVGTCTDIDDLKQTETVLRETDARLREAQRIARLGSWCWEPQTDWVWWSDAEFELFGVDRKIDPSFDAFLALLHPEDRMVAIARVDAMRAGANEFANDLRVIRPNGDVMWIHSRAVVKRDAEGKLVRVEGIDQDITERRMAEIAAKANAQQMQAAIEVASLGVIVIDYNRQTAELSERAAEQFGIPAARIVTRADLHARFHPGDVVALEQLTARAFDPNGPGQFNLEHRVIWPDGTVRWLNVCKQVSFTADRPHRAVVVIADVTERRNAEETLRASETKYRLLFESNPHPMWVYNMDTFAFLAVNDAAVRSYGYTRSEFLAMSIRDIRPVEELPRLEEAVARLTVGHAQSSPWKHRRKDGSLFDVEISSYDLDAGDGRSRLVMALDISERLRAEEARDEALARLQLHIDRMPVAYVLFDAEIRFSDWNPAAERIFGYTRDEIIGQSLAFLVHPEDRLHVDAVSQRLQAGDVAAKSINRNVTKDGRVITCEWHNIPLFAANKTFVGILSMTLDITDRVRAESSLRESERRLRLALEAASAIAFTWDVKNDIVTRYFSTEPALPVTSKHLGTLAEVRERVHPDDRPGFEARVTECLASGTEYRNQYRVIRPDETIACLEEYGYLDRATEGTPLFLTGMSINVTDRVVAAEALRASEERFQEAARVAGFGVFEHDHRTESYYWSPRLREIYGYAQSAPIDLKAYLSMIHPDDREVIAAAVCKAHDPAGDGRFDVVHRLVRPADQRVLWLTTQSQTTFEGDGPNRRPVRTVGATVDITESRLAAEALELSEARYRQLADMLPTAIFVHADNTILYGNPAFMRLLGAQEEDQILGRSPFDIVDPSFHTILRQRQEALKSGMTLPGCEMRAVRCDGRSVPVYTIAAPIAGYGYPAILVALSDLTEHERTTALLRSVLDSVGDAILTIDAQGTISSANAATERLFGYLEEELIGGNVSVLMAELHHQQYDRCLADYLRTGLAHVIGIGREVAARRKDGTTFPAELTVTEFSRDGERHFTVVLRDITARRQLEDQFRHAQKMEAVGRLAGGVAHDFNNLLTVINGYSELLIAGISADSPSQKPLVAILNAGERAARLTKQLLAFSRKSVVEPRLVDLNELVAESASLLRRLIGEDIDLSVINCAAPVRIMIDPGQLEQVLMNLAVNARDAMPTGGQLSIETNVVEFGEQASRLHPELRSGQYASLRVADTGCGMTLEVREKIFEPFFTTKGLGKGTGLGLAVVHGVVQQSGGKVTVESSVGEGTAFTVFLPTTADVAYGEASQITRVAPIGSEAVLVVEDEDAVRMLAQVALEEKGYTVLSALDGREALALLGEYPGLVDLLVTDVIMPGMSGREVAEAARSLRPGLRVLYMSGYTDDALDRHGLQGTGDQFIQKPFTPLSLARKVRDILEKADEGTPPIGTT